MASALFNALKPFIYGDTGKYFDVFAVGMFLALVYTFIQSPSAGERWKAALRQSNPFILAGGVALLVFLPLQQRTALNSGGHTLTPDFSDPHIPLLVMEWMQWPAVGYSIGYGLCLWALLFGTAGLKRPFEGSLLRWFGSISFGLYMWHLPFMFIFIYVIARNIHIQAWNPIVQYCLFWCWALVVIIPVSAAFYHWVEKPGIRLGERLIAATQTWGKKRSVVLVHPVISLNEVGTTTHAGGQFKGHILVREIQRTASHGIPVPSNGDWDRIITQVPPVLPRAFPVNSQAVPVPSASTERFGLRPLS
jgi:peptidoglycan/LPS O-acetylase OafA/YrhL